MSLTLSSAARSAMADALVDLLDAGSGAATLQIRSGTRPAGPGTTATGPLLATVTLGDPAFGSASSGVATMVDPASVLAVASGTASWFRILDSNSLAIIDGKVGATSSGADLELGTTSLTTGLTVDITGGTITQPAGTAD